MKQFPTCVLNCCRESDVVSSDFVKKLDCMNIIIISAFRIT